VKVKIHKTAVLPFVLYGCEIQSLTLREEHRLRVSKNSCIFRISILCTLHHVLVLNELKPGKKSQVEVKALAKTEPRDEHSLGPYAALKSKRNS
jgi:hypothetical protein